MAVTLGSAVLNRYARFSLYNSPYPAHDAGCAIDLYPGTLRDGRTTTAPSPVSGTVLETRTVRAPPKPYAPEHDHLILLECDAPASASGLVARILHVDPAVDTGENVEMGDDLGTLVRAGFFAPWVDNHLHVGFRSPDQNPYRASGSLPLELDVPVRPLEWDGTGRVLETGDTYAILDAPRHPDPSPDAQFVGIGVDRTLGSSDGSFGSSSGSLESTDGLLESSVETLERGVIDGGLPHYDGGGLLGRKAETCGSARLNGDQLGVVRGRTITWDDVTVTANDTPITGLSFFCARDADFGAKLICPEQPFEVGTTVRVRIDSR